MTGEMLTAVGALVAALATALGVALPIARAAGRHSNYERWMAISKNTGDEVQQKAAQDRATHYFVDMAAADLTRSDRVGAVFGGLFLLFFATGSYVLQLFLPSTDEFHSDRELLLFQNIVVVPGLIVTGLYFTFREPQKKFEDARRSVRVLLKLPVEPETPVPNDWMTAWYIRERNAKWRKIDADVTDHLLRDSAAHLHRDAT